MRMKNSSGPWARYGGLGADVDNENTVIKRAIHAKVKDFSDQLRDVNRTKIQSETIDTKPKPAPVRPPSNREKALQFAQRIPKPPARPVLVSIDSDVPVDPENTKYGYLESLLKQHAEMERVIQDVRQRNFT